MHSLCTVHSDQAVGVGRPCVSSILLIHFAFLFPPSLGPLLIWKRSMSLFPVICLIFRSELKSQCLFFSLFIFDVALCAVNAQGSLVLGIDTVLVCRDTTPQYTVHPNPSQPGISFSFSKRGVARQQVLLAPGDNVWPVFCGT